MPRSAAKLLNTIVANNSCEGPIFSLGNNLETGDTCGFILGGDLIDVTDAGLLDIGDNGGPTWTCALDGISPAIDAGNSNSVTTDQRLFPRDASVDIGAYEFGAKGFNKTAPTNGATGQSLTPQLSWGTSTWADSYEYCYDITDDSACAPWTSTTNTSVSLSGLTPNTTYYWQVRAVDTGGTTEADGGAWWSFTTLIPPEPFNKTAPTNGATGQSLTPQISWGTSTWAVNYEYCYDITDDSACAPWTDPPIPASPSPA